MDNCSSGTYVCVHCGAPIKCLIKKYSSTVLKLVNCGNCDNVADKYVEYDDVIILIDIILFNKHAYRHLLYNTKFKNHWKLALFILIVKVMDQWLCFKAKHNPKYFQQNLSDSIISTECVIFFITVLGEAIFFLIISAFFLLFWRVPVDKSNFLTEISMIWKAVVSSSFGYFLLLPSLMWNDFQRDVHLLFIYTYTLLSHIQALTVVFKIPKPLLSGILVLAAATNHGISSFLIWCFNL